MGDVYLTMTDTQIHWFSIVNSLLILIFLSGMVAMIIMRTLHADFHRYHEMDLQEEAQEETGWKLVHGDVFRPPPFRMALSVLIGSGVQVFYGGYHSHFCSSRIPFPCQPWWFDDRGRGSLLVDVFVLGLLLCSYVQGLQGYRMEEERCFDCFCVAPVHFRHLLYP